MKKSVEIVTAFTLAVVGYGFGCTAIASVSPEVGSGVLAEYEGAVVTQGDFDAFLNTVPAESRSEFLRSPERVERTLNNLMLRKRALAVLESRGAIDSPLFSALVQREVDKLALETLQENFLRENMLSDYTLIAREIYLTEPENFRSTVTVDFSHIAVAPIIDDDPTGGMRLILDVYDEAVVSNDLKPLAEEFGDSASDSKSGGYHEGIMPRQLERVIARELGQLEVGEISVPMRTSSGWHIMQLSARHEGKPQNFEDVKDKAISIAKSRHKEQLTTRFVDDLVSGRLTIPAGAIRLLLDRHGVVWSD